MPCGRNITTAGLFKHLTCMQKPLSAQASPASWCATGTPAQPLLVGGLAPTEEGRGYLQLRLKRHRWFGRVLKTRDPLIFSIGWRRFQSVPVYATEDANGRHRRVLFCPIPHSKTLHYVPRTVNTKQPRPCFPPAGGKKYSE